MTFTFALYAALVRRFRNASVVCGAAVSAFLGIIPAWFFTDPLAIGTPDLPPLAAFGVTYRPCRHLVDRGRAPHSCR